MYLYIYIIFIYIYIHLFPPTPPSPFPPVLSVVSPLCWGERLWSHAWRCATYLQIWSCHTKTFSTTASGSGFRVPPWGWWDVTVGMPCFFVFVLRNHVFFSTLSVYKHYVGDGWYLRICLNNLMVGEFWTIFWKKKVQNACNSNGRRH